MKKSMLKAAFVSLGLLIAGSVFAQTSADNLLFGANASLPAANPGYASAMKVGKAPSGAKAVIVSSENCNGDIAYRLRVDFTQPVKLRGVTKVHIEWEALDPAIVKAGGKEMIFSIFTLNSGDNSLYRKGNLDYAKRGEDKKSIFMTANGFQSFEAVYDLSADYQAWTDTSYDGSTKQITALEIYMNLGSASKGDSADAFKGLAVKNIWFE